MKLSGLGVTLGVLVRVLSAVTKVGVLVGVLLVLPILLLVRVMPWVHHVRVHGWLGSFADSKVLDVGPTEDNVVVDFISRRDRVFDTAILGTEGTDYGGEEKS